jgi:hypothetical protein
MSYTTQESLGGLPSASSFAAGAEFSLGYTVTGFAAGAAPGAVQLLRDAISSVLQGTIVAVQWGPAFGIPSGVLAARIRLGSTLTGAQLNGIGTSIGSAFQSRLRSGGSPSATVRNSYLHTDDMARVAADHMARVVAEITESRYRIQQDPGTTPDPAADPLREGQFVPQSDGFFSRSVGGIPMWGIAVGGVLVVGAIGFALMPKAKARAAPVAAAIKANRRRRQSRRR